MCSIFSSPRKALLIGINGDTYIGCDNDVTNFSSFLKEKLNFKEKDITKMITESNEQLKPSRKNIIKQLDELVAFAKSYTFRTVYLVVLYAGFGRRIADKDGEESDGYDEAMCPIDCDTNGYLRDDDLKTYFIEKLPKNVKLFMVADSTQHGNFLDLKYCYQLYPANTMSANLDMIDSSQNIILISGARSQDEKKYEKQYKTYKSWEEEYQGAVSACLLSSLKKGITYNKLLKDMHRWLLNYDTKITIEVFSGKKLEPKSKLVINSLF